MHNSAPHPYNDYSRVSKNSVGPNMPSSSVATPATSTSVPQNSGSHDRSVDFNSSLQQPNYQTVAQQGPVPYSCSNDFPQQTIRAQTSLPEMLPRTLLPSDLQVIIQPSENFKKQMANMLRGFGLEPKGGVKLDVHADNGCSQLNKNSIGADVFSSSTAAYGTSSTQLQNFGNPWPKESESEIEREIEDDRLAVTLDDLCEDDWREMEREIEREMEEWKAEKLKQYIKTKNGVIKKVITASSSSPAFDTQPMKEVDEHQEEENTAEQNSANDEHQEQESIAEQCSVDKEYQSKEVQVTNNLLVFRFGQNFIIDASISKILISFERPIERSNLVVTNKILTEYIGQHIVPFRETDNNKFLQSKFSPIFYMHFIYTWIDLHIS